MNVYDTANKLAQEIRESQEYISYKNMKDEIMSNPELKSKIEEFEKLRYDIQLMQYSGEQKDEEKMKKLENMYAILIDANKASGTRIKLTNSTSNTTIMLTFNNNTATEYNYTALVNNLYYTINVKTGTANTIYITRDAFGVDTSDATANATDLLLDKTAYNADGKITGTIEDYNGEME